MCPPRSKWSRTVPHSPFWWFILQRDSPSHTLVRLYFCRGLFSGLLRWLSGCGFHSTCSRSQATRAVQMCLALTLTWVLLSWVTPFLLFIATL